MGYSRLGRKLKYSYSNESLTGKNPPRDYHRMCSFFKTTKYTSRGIPDDLDLPTPPLIISEQTHAQIMKEIEKFISSRAATIIDDYIELSFTSKLFRDKNRTMNNLRLALKLKKQMKYEFNHEKLVKILEEIKSQKEFLNKMHAIDPIKEEKKFTDDFDKKDWLENFINGFRLCLKNINEILEEAGKKSEPVKQSRDEEVEIPLRVMKRS